MSVYFLYCNSVETGRLNYFHQCEDKTEFLGVIDRFIETYKQCDIPCNLGLTYNHYIPDSTLEYRISFTRESVSPKDYVGTLKTAKAFIESSDE